MHYVYRQLPLNHSGVIRLLSLLPDEFDAPLRGRLECVDILDARDYTPVSYTWNNPERTDRLNLDSGTVDLTRSVHDLLRRLRLTDRPRRLWVDQVCINQNDDSERSNQVRYMSSIFNRAENILVWLGHDESGDAVAAFDLVHKLAGLLPFRHAETESSAGRLADLIETGTDWEPLRKLTKRDWFTRTWVVQEIGTSVPAKLLWGSAEIDWDVLSMVCDGLHQEYHLREALKINISMIRYHHRRFVEPARTSRHANRFNFIYELHRARQLEVSDPRDRVFAFLGHFSRLKSDNIALLSLSANYEHTTTEEVYIDVAKRALLDNDDPLITLAAVQHKQLVHPGDRTARTTLPSWVPDWRINQSFILSEPTSPHRAGAVCPAGVEISQDGTVLRISGVYIDTVAAASGEIRQGAFHLDRRTDDQIQAGSTVLKLWCEFLRNSLPVDIEEQYPNKEPAIFAFMQTLSNGCVSSWWKGKQELAYPQTMLYQDLPPTQWNSYGRAYLSSILPRSDLPGQIASEACDTQTKTKAWIRAANAACKGRVFAQTREGYFVLGPKVLEEGDVVVILFGGKMPYCLRPVREGYLLVGECYVYGFMNGEIAGMLEKGSVQSQVFQIL